MFPLGTRAPVAGVTSTKARFSSSSTLLTPRHPSSPTTTRRVGRDLEPYTTAAPPPAHGDEKMRERLMRSA
ncbi:hypothetical protein PTSG_11948 [Salpingoeca rosetta]|uniref:Uncharacterized protein n=1 Tax=Salpingoeca rosetta (strain ATCC 50818 / BSB-021) TaxID=946362 RepID=F2U3X8_SALR5|nr:uncharacterized protein PTSG_11948 [Salpingoeca rosetta]EGD82322.1 hypothetical protein PTSG_11948 [Salpingoeca rosetta]|eukprot:XP_004996505.1 hypothetical protein PTSG_11948 [Salpingoeca rosetta]